METRAPYALVGVFVLAVVAAVFGFVYWLHNSSGLADRTLYRLRFENTVSGLLTGAAVLFNGIRVGEVTALELNAGAPNQIMVTIAVAPGTPVRTDTKVGLDFQGLTGVPVVTLQGGSTPLAGTAPHLLVADPRSGQSMTSAARDTLRRLDGVLVDNADTIRSTIANLNTFTAALARNSDKLDGIVSSLERLTGGGATNAPRVVYDLTVPEKFPGLGRVPDGQLAIAEPTALIAFETRKLLVRPESEEPSFVSAEWSDNIPKLLHAKIIQAFENAGLARTVARSAEGISADHQLLIDIRKFQLTRSTEPSADIEFIARIVAPGGRILEARLFQSHAPAKALNAPAAVAAFNEAFARCATDLVAWAAGVI
jgi:phospholipid/cholesterol/gamma-HCH transport system substrate-binding protein